jgi:signal transduction histidine kinase
VFRFKSLLARIVFIHMVAIVVTAIFTPVLLDVLFKSDVEKLERRAMRGHAEALAQRLVHRPDGWAADLTPAMRDFYSEAYGRYAFAIVDDTGTVLLSSRKDRMTQFPADYHTAEIKFVETRRGDRVIIGVSLKRSLEGQAIWIQVAQDVAHNDVLMDDVVANFFHQVGWIPAPILLLLLAFDILIFRRAVQPLLRASERAEQISPTRSDVRLPTHDIPREIMPLVVAVNKALDRLAWDVRRQREFTGDVAHELRTPLAILRTRIETLPDQTSAKALLRDVEAMTRVVSQLLEAAEVEAFVIDPKEMADLRTVCADIAEFIAPWAIAQGKTISLSGTDAAVWVHGNAAMLRRAVRNLIENALKHTPEGTGVDIVVGEDATIRIVDQGEGVPAGRREMIFKRFWRRDRRGSGGLGLSIVKRIVDVHGGTVTVEDAPNGGAVFMMSLPKPVATR